MFNIVCNLVNSFRKDRGETLLIQNNKETLRENDVYTLASKDHQWRPPMLSLRSLEQLFRSTCTTFVICTYLARYNVTKDLGRNYVLKCPA